MKAKLFGILFQFKIIFFAWLAFSTVKAYTQNGLQFNGTNQYVTFGGPSSGLNATAFTLEAWIRIEGAGVTTATSGTGGGGFDNVTPTTGAVPLVTKGRGEGESPANININYFMGLQENKLVADFEEATGPNHAVIGVTVIPLNTWTHVAATYEPVTAIWNLYINGVLDRTLDIGSNINPANTSIQHAGLATAMTSAGAAAGFFAGKIDEARIWNVARTQPEIAANMNLELTAGVGLAGSWGLNDGTGATATNSIAGSPAGTLMLSPVWVCGAPAMDFTPAIPTALSVTAAGFTQINLSWTDNATNETGFEIERSTTGIGGAYTLLATVGSNIVAFSDLTVVGATEYCYRVRAKNCTLNSGYAGPICATTPTPLPPVAPSGLTVAAPNAYQVNISWTDNSTDETNFQIERSTTGIAGTYTLLATAGANIVSYIDSAINSSYEYCYRVRAINVWGNSAYAGPLCATTLTETANALQLTPNTYVSFGPAPSLATQNFTVETWFKRTAAGTAVSTGSGGIVLVPILAKGSPEADGSTVDANYILGISSTNKIAADFEEGTGSASPGLNHPIVGTTTIVNDVWYHVATTFQNGIFSLYLNGILETTLNLGVSVWPQGASSQHAALGTMLNSSGASTGFFAGVIDEARIWNYQRTETQIQSTVNSQIITPQAGLLARWGLNESSGTIVHANAGTTVNGTITGTGGYSWVNPGAPFNLVFIPPATPSGFAITTISSSILQLNWTDNSNDETGFQIERSTTGAGGPFSLLTAVAANVVSYDNTGLTPSTNYCYRVRAVNGNLYSAYTSIVCATTLPSGPVTISFQDGVNSYTGTRDTYIWETLPTTPRGTETTFVQDKNPGDERRSLLRFDLSSIPSGVTITSATLQFYVDVEGQGFNMHRMLVPWDEATVTFSSIGNRHFAANNTDAESVVNASWPGVDTYVGPITVTVLPSTLQNWINGTMTNNGWLMIATHADDGQQLRSREHATVADRPKLTVTYAINPPDLPTNPLPVDNGIAASASPNICATVSDLDGGNLTVRFYGRRKTNANTKFTVIGLPDTQFYTEEPQGQNSGGGGHNGIFKAQTQWIADHRVDSSVAFVVQLGDCVQNGDNPPGADDSIEYRRADTALRLIENPNVPLTHGIPYGICVGNHDQGTIGDPDAASVYYNQYFGEARFLGRTYYGGHYSTNNENHFELFNEGGIDFIHISLEYYPNGTTPSLQAKLDWADALLKAYPNRKGILSTHNMLTTGNPASFQGPGQKIYDDLKDNPNLILMLAGHVAGEGRRTDVFNGNTIHTLMSDYQTGYTNGGNGYLRIMQFFPGQNLLSVKTYSPYSNTSLTTSSSQFTLPVNLSQPFTLLGTNLNVASGSQTCINWPSLIEGEEYEWYVEVSDGLNTTTGPVWNFSVPGHTWYGTADANWTNSSNWAASGVHVSGTNLTIATTGLNPILPGPVTTGNIKLNSGTTINLTDKTLTINGEITGTGAFSGADNSNLIINGVAGILNFNQTSAATRSLKNLTINSGASATLGSALDLYGTLALSTATLNLNAQNLTLKSDIAGTARIGNLTGSILAGATNVTMERYIPLRAGNGRAYRYLSSTVNTTANMRNNWMEGGQVTVSGGTSNPVPNYGTHITGSGILSNNFDVTLTNESSIYTTANGGTCSTMVYAPLANASGTMASTQGYFLLVRGNRSEDLLLPTAPGMPTSITTLRTKGTLLTGTQTAFGTMAGGEGSLNQVTNPYPSPIDWESVRTNCTGIKTAYTLWDPNLGNRGGFVTWSLGSGASSGAASRFIQPGQAFFIEASGATAPTVSVQESDKATGNNNGVFFTPPPPAEGFRIELYYMEPSNFRRAADGAIAIFNNSYSTGNDINDASEINNWDENIAIAREGKHLAIEARPVITNKDTLPLFMNNMKQQSYEFEFTPAQFTNTGLKAELIDNFLATRTLLSVTNPTVVTFTVTADPASADTNRFTVVFGPLSPLAIDVLSINAKPKYQSLAQGGNGVEVNWSSNSETDMDSYELERSFNGSGFNKIYTRMAVGNSPVAVNYSWLDISPQTGNNFYRIKAIDKAGLTKYTSIVKVNFGKQQSDITIIPNLVTGNCFELQLNEINKGTYDISIVNNIGQTIYNTPIQHNGGSVIIPIKTDRNMANGIYMVVLTGENIRISKRLFKN